ncbi:MAG: hypothetical protein ACOY5F_00170 [Pseudomonadota bacterium]
MLISVPVRILTFALTVAAGGCAGHDIEAVASRPGKFRLYDCALLDKRGGELLKREQELADLMQKARQSAGGELAVAIAYQNEYNTVKGDLREIELTGADRKCALKYRTASDRAVR